IMLMGVRAPAARNIVATGSGIGLWATSIVIKKHRGRLEVESKIINKKIAQNIFTIILPIRR
ncbi:MAG: hypothetical protein JW956_05680, partial [Calditrichaceae bacterium]|nr:hypothetical protein [Calditrichaceae bacterium]